MVVNKEKAWMTSLGVISLLLVVVVASWLFYKSSLDPEPMNLKLRYVEIVSDSEDSNPLDIVKDMTYQGVTIVRNEVLDTITSSQQASSTSRFLVIENVGEEDLSSLNYVANKITLYPDKEFVEERTFITMGLKVGEMIVLPRAATSKDLSIHGDSYLTETEAVIYEYLFIRSKRKEGVYEEITIRPELGEKVIIDNNEMSG